MAELKEITDQNYQKEVIESDDIWSISFSAFLLMRLQSLT